MKEGMKVKVIKKDEIRPPTIKVKAISKRASAREMVSNVTSWVTDAQARKREEARGALEKLFNTQPQPSEL